MAFDHTRRRVASSRGRLRSVPTRARLLTALLAASLAASGCATSSYDLGRARLDDGDTTAAIDAFDASIEAGDRVFEATRERGAARLEAGDVQQAIADLEAASAMRSGDERLYWLLGKAYASAERYADAAKAYRSYEEVTRVRNAQQLARLRVAQLRHEFDQAVAREIVVARRSGQAPDPNSLAVYAFRPEAGDQATLQDVKICRALNIWVAADLAKVKSVHSIALDQLKAIYAEQGLGYDQIRAVDPSTALSMGNIQPARHMVQGLFGTIGDRQVLMGASCLDVTRQETTSCSALNGPTDQLFDMETQLVLDILGSMDITPTPEERLAIGDKPTRNLEAFLAFADGVYLRDTGDYEGAAAAFQKASQADPGFGMAADEAAATEVAAAPNAAPIQVPAPPTLSSTASERVARSTQFLGLGITPEGESNGETSETTDVVIVRGEATLLIRGRAGDGQ